jgi:hypothetical protein
MSVGMMKEDVRGGNEGGGKRLRRATTSEERK